MRVKVLVASLIVAITAILAGLLFRPSAESDLVDSLSLGGTPERIRSPGKELMALKPKPVEVEPRLPIEREGSAAGEREAGQPNLAVSTRDLVSLDRLHEARFGGMDVVERRDALFSRLEQVDNDLYRNVHIKMLNEGDYEQLGEIEWLESGMKRIPFSKHRRASDVPFITMMHESLTGHVVRTTLEMENLPGQQDLLEEVAWLWRNARGGGTLR